jgi:hypothetical protein
VSLELRSPQSGQSDLIDSPSFTEVVDPSLLDRSGSVFYSGREAFSKPAKIYVLGLNPGGSAERQCEETIGRQIEEWNALPPRWSAYVDHGGGGAVPGTWGIQPRMRCMFASLGLDPRGVPTSNVVFVRSANEKELAAEMGDLLAKCWPFHAAVIKALGITTVACLGGTAGQWLRACLGADEKVGCFKERNSRRWKSYSHANRDGLRVITLTHPGQADWRNPLADPTSLVRDALFRS